MYQSNYDPDKAYLEDELERYQQEEADRIDQERQQRKEREKEWREGYEIERHSAGTWPEALRKQASLFAQESSLWWRGNEEFPDDYFGPGAKACERALEIWTEVQKSRQNDIAELQAKLEAIQDEIRIKVARLLAEEDKRVGWQSVASAIEEDEDLNNWLNW